MQVTDEMAVEAVMKAQSIGLFPKVMHQDDLNRLCEQMAIVIQAALSVAPVSTATVAS